MWILGFLLCHVSPLRISQSFPSRDQAMTRTGDELSLAEPRRARQQQQLSLRSEVRVRVSHQQPRQYQQLGLVLALALLASPIPALAETPSLAPPPPPLCSSLSTPTPTCLGVVDGLLADCGNKNSCTSSQDDRPGVFSPPWQIEGFGDAMDKLVVAVEQRKDFKQILTYDREGEEGNIQFVYIFV